MPDNYPSPLPGDKAVCGKDVLVPLLPLSRHVVLDKLVPSLDLSLPSSRIRLTQLTMIYILKLRRVCLFGRLPGYFGKPGMIRSALHTGNKVALTAQLLYHNR